MCRRRRCRFGRSDYSEVGVVRELRSTCKHSCERVYVVYEPTWEGELE